MHGATYVCINSRLWKNLLLVKCLLVGRRSCVEFLTSTLSLGQCPFILSCLSSISNDVIFSSL